MQPPLLAMLLPSLVLQPSLAPLMQPPIPLLLPSPLPLHLSILMVYILGAA